MCRSLRAPTKWTSSPRSPTRRKVSFARSGFSLSKLTRKLLLCCPPCAIRSASWWWRAPPNPPAKSLSPPATSYARSMVCPSPRSTVCAASSKTSRPAVPSRFKSSAKTGSFLYPSHSTSPDRPVVMYIGGFRRASLWTQESSEATRPENARGNLDRGELTGLAMLPFALTIFLSAFLLFQVQLLLAKFILPWFGGSPAVWTTCNLFFEVFLLGGYAYGHWISTRLTPQAQKRLHHIVLLASLAVLGVQAAVWKSPLTPDKSWQPASESAPIVHILILLAVCVGLPFLILSSTAPLLQAWLRQTHSQDSVYRLYALSNLGSLLALLSYPFLVEPWLSLRTQARVWAWGFLAFALCCGY